MGVLDDPNFWQYGLARIGQLKSDGVLNYVLLDKTFRMLPIIRNTKTTFTDFLANDGEARKCSVIVNGNMYGLSVPGYIAASPLGGPDAPSDTEIHGQIIKNGKVIAGASEPGYFWFGQIFAPTRDAWSWTYRAGSGDPPEGSQTISAIGGVGPLVISSLKYGDFDQYKPGAPANAPKIGQPPAAALPYLVQRSSNTLAKFDQYPDQAGKTFIAYCSSKRIIMIGVQQDNSSPGCKMSYLANALSRQGFDTAVFLDGSDSATLIFKGKIVVRPGDRKNKTIVAGIGFYK